MLRRCFQLCALLVFPCRDLRCALEVIGGLLESPSGHGPERRLICLIYIKVRVAWVAHGGSPGVEVGVMAKPFPLNPKHPERICWGCDKYCATRDQVQHWSILGLGIVLFLLGAKGGALKRSSPPQR